MRVMKPQRLGLLTKTIPHRGKGLFVVSTFSLFELQDPTDILLETAMWPLVAQELPKGSVFDAALPKPFGEFLIAGKAMSPNPVEAMHVAVSVGSNTRYLSIFGDRFWQTTRDGALLSDPVPFTEMPLSADRAFGGEGFDANPAGRGYHAAALQDHVDVVRLPNVELAGSEIRSINRTATPALVGPVPLDNPARLKLAGTFDKTWVATQMPDWPDNFDPRYYMAAVKEQHFLTFLKGDEPVRVVGMSAKVPDIQSNLPGIRARAFVALHSKPGRLTEVEMHTDTAWILGSELKGVVVNRGAMTVSDLDATDVADVMVAYEWLKDDPRPAEYYHEVYKLRSDPDERFKYLLSDGQLSPAETAEEAERREQLRIAEAEARREKWIENRQWSMERHYAEQGLPSFMIPKIEEPDLKLFITPSKEDIARGDVDIARLISDADELRKEAELKVDMINAEVMGLVEQIGIEPPYDPRVDIKEMEALNEVAVTDESYLPAFEEIVPQNEFDQFLKTFEEGPTPDLAAAPQVDVQSAFEAAKFRFTNSAAAGLFVKAKEMVDAIPPSPVATERGADDTAALETAESVDQPDTMGDLEGTLDEFLTQTFPGLAEGDGARPASRLRDAMASLPGAGDDFGDPRKVVGDQLAQAEDGVDEGMLEARRLSIRAVAPLEALPGEASDMFGEFVKEHVTAGGSLAGHDLAGAALRAENFSDADLKGSFLEKCILTGAVLCRASCDAAVFTGADLTEADLSEAVLFQANLSEVSAKNASFRKVKWTGSICHGADFTGCDFSGAILEDCQFIECKFPAADFSGAALTGCTFVKSDLSGLKAARVQLEKTRFVASSLGQSDLSHAMLKKVTFANASFQSVNLADAVLDTCGWFGETDMKGVNCTNVRADKCGFQDANLSEGTFVRAVFDRCNLSKSNLRLADMRLSSWRGSLFAFSQLEKADFFGANLRGAMFRGADLAGCNLRSTNLYQADLSEAVLSFADFTGSNLKLTHTEARV